METIVYTQAGKKKGTATLPEDIFGLSWNADLVHQVIVAQQANARQNVADVKDRSEVRGGGIKPWRQKGTGRARHGSNRSPIWVGGGVTHGPLSAKDYSQKVNRKMSTQALFTILSKKFADGEIIFLDSLVLEDGKTKEAQDIIKSLSGLEGFEALTAAKGRKALITLSGDNKDTTKRGFKNIGTVRVHDVENLNASDALTYSYIVIADVEKSLEFLKAKQK